MNLTQKYLPFLCLCYQSPCALLLIGGICDRDVIVVYFSGVGNLEFWQISSYINCRDFAVIFAKKCAMIFTIFCRDFLMSLLLGDRYHVLIARDDDFIGHMCGKLDVFR